MRSRVTEHEIGVASSRTSYTTTLKVINACLPVYIRSFYKQVCVCTSTAARDSLGSWARSRSLAVCP